MPPRPVRSVLLVWASLSLVPFCVAAAERVTVTVLATSDLHGHIYPFDYYANQPANRGLAKIATLIKQVRKDKPETLLVDCGDTIEGSPLAQVHARHVRGKDPQAGPDPMMLVMNALEYDAMAVGNHEFNFGMDVLMKAMKDARFDWLSANVTPAATATEALGIRNKQYGNVYESLKDRTFTPMIVEDVKGVTVAIIGLTTPAVPNWERPEHIESYRFEPVVPALREWVKHAREVRKADVVIVAAHLGLERSLEDATPFQGQLPGENGVYQLAMAVPGIDAIIFGHTHQELSGRSVNGVILAQPKNWGQSLAKVDIVVERESKDAPWKVVEKNSHTLPVTDQTAADPEILAMAEAYHRAAMDYLEQPVAESKAVMETRLGRVQDTAAADLIHEVQLAAGKADVSMSAMYTTSLLLPAGAVKVRQLAALYPYENTLVVVEATGQMVKDALEHSARFYGGCDSLNPQTFGFNYDTAAGVTYKIDVTRPVGQRILDLQFKGAPLSPTQTLRVAINNYRKAGGGGYAMYRGAKVLWQSSTDIRQLMIDYYGEKKVMEGRVDHNWRVVPESCEKALATEAQRTQRDP